MKSYIYILIFLLIFTLFIYYFFIKINFKDLNKNGYIIIKNILNQEDCDKIMMTVNTEMIEKKKEEFFILSSKNRKHLALPLDDNIKHIIKIIYNKINPIITNNYKNPILVECGIFLSYPGSDNQPWHRDSEKNSKTGKLITFAIALDKISEFNGPLELYDKSHNYPENKYKKLNRTKNEIFKPNVFKKIICKCERGDLIIWDSNIIHRGSKNYSTSIRPLFYFSLLDKNDKSPIGPAYTLKSEYSGKVDLKKIIL